MRNLAVTFAQIPQHPVLGTLCFLFSLYSIILVIRIILSWINIDPYNSLVRFLYAITDPVLDYFRRVIPIRFGMLDLSPLVVFGILWLLQLLFQLLMPMVKI